LAAVENHPQPIEYASSASAVPNNLAAFCSIGLAVLGALMDIALWLSMDTGGNTCSGLLVMSAIALAAPGTGIAVGTNGTECGRRDRWVAFLGIMLSIASLLFFLGQVAYFLANLRVG
jgi:hypothetical protein